MASAVEIAERHQRARRRLIRALTVEANRTWRAIDPANLDAWWIQHSRRLMVLLTTAQLAAARQADTYTDRVLTAQDIDPAAAGQVRADALAGVASDGRPLDGLMASPTIAAKQAIGNGKTIDQALAAGQSTLAMILGTQVADAGRAADSIAITARTKVGGYVRMLNPPSCSRCAVLAGKWFRWNTGFARHPRCDCIHVPASEDTADDLTTDPAAYFRSLSKTEQDRIFTKAGARAVRDGADIGQVVNARRGMTTTAAGRQITREGITRSGFAGRQLGTTQGVRLMPEQIYRDATSREDAIRLLRRFGYLT